MARRVTWKRSIDDKTSWRQDQALNARIFIVRTIGPTGFMLVEEGSEAKHKVLVGDPHMCNCAEFRRTATMCVHIAWVLLKRFRIPRTNPASWQLGLVESEIDDILRGKYSSVPVVVPQRTSRIDLNDNEQIPQRDIGPGDICSICQEDFLSKRQPVSWCRYSCGQNVHIKCIKLWADHQRSKGKKDVECPMCREKFDSWENLLKEYTNTRPSGLKLEPPKHEGSICHVCGVLPITGNCYKCLACAAVYICQSCFAGPCHSEHKFAYKRRPGQRWRVAERQNEGVMSILSELQQREITDRDYETLLQLESTSTGSIAEEFLNFLPGGIVRKGNALLRAGTQCRLCLKRYSVNEPYRKLPCNHRVKDYLSEKADGPKKVERLQNPGALPRFEKDFTLVAEPFYRLKSGGGLEDNGMTNGERVCSPVHSHSAGKKAVWHQVARRTDSLRHNLKKPQKSVERRVGNLALLAGGRAGLIATSTKQSNQTAVNVQDHSVSSTDEAIEAKREPSLPIGEINLAGLAIVNTALNPRLENLPSRSSGGVARNSNNGKCKSSEPRIRLGRREKLERCQSWSQPVDADGGAGNDSRLSEFALNVTPYRVTPPTKNMNDATVLRGVVNHNTDTVHAITSFNNAGGEIVETQIPMEAAICESNMRSNAVNVNGRGRLNLRGRDVAVGSSYAWASDDEGKGTLATNITDYINSTDGTAYRNSERISTMNEEALCIEDNANNGDMGDVELTPYRLTTQLGGQRGGFWFGNRRQTTFD